MENITVNETFAAVEKMVTNGTMNGTLLMDRTEIAKALNFEKYPVLTYNLDDEKGGAKARVKKQRINSKEELTYNCKLFMGYEKQNDGTFYLMTKATMIKAGESVEDYMEMAEFANAPIIESGQEVAILVYSKKHSMRFVLIATAGKVDPSYSTATKFKY